MVKTFHTSEMPDGSLKTMMDDVPPRAGYNDNKGNDMSNRKDERNSKSYGVELLHCPFCNDSAGVELLNPEETNGHHWWVCCGGCACKKDGHSKKQAVNSWNRRNGELLIKQEF